MANMTEWEKLGMGGQISASVSIRCVPSDSAGIRGRPRHVWRPDGSRAGDMGGRWKKMLRWQKLGQGGQIISSFGFRGHPRYVWAGDGSR